MAKLMDSLTSFDHSVRRKYKKVFEKLSDGYIIRTPVLESTSISNIIIEGPNQSWLLIGNHPAPPELEELEKYLALNNTLRSNKYNTLRYLAVCKEDESLFSTVNYSKYDIHVVAQTAFWENGETLINTLLCQFGDEAHHWLKKAIVTETVISASCTTRRVVTTRDNSAQLDHFFLDYDQELATKYDMWGDAHSDELEESFSVRLINGVAGCGKTLILINRAILYCKKYPEKQTLLLIHNTPIIKDITFKFEAHLDGQPRNLTICTFHKYARAQQTKLTRWLNAIFGNKELEPFKNRIFSDNYESYKALNISNDQLWSELEFINEFLIKDKDHYLEYDRHGRGFSLSKSQREHVWELYETTCDIMSSPQTGYLPSLYIRNLCLNKNDDIEFDAYDHILIDEAQFFAPSWLELVKKSINPKGQLFICADPNQGFLKRHLSWKSIGLNVRGRTKKLNYSYRTTYEIMVAANALLTYFKDDSEDFIQPDLSQMTRGQKPHIIYSDSTQDEQQRFLNELTACVKQHQVPSEQIIVLCNESVSPWTTKRIIEHRLGPNTALNYNNPKESRDQRGKIRIMTINSCTGMEAGVIFVLGVGGLLDKVNNIGLNEEEKAEIYQESTRKLYVAMTRAGQRLVLFSTQKLPASVEKHAHIDGTYVSV